MTQNNRERTYEYTISFESGNLVKVPGGWFISGASVNLARKCQHRHENPSAAKRRKRKPNYKSLREYIEIRKK